jgi:RES domain-containing protein
VHGGRFNAKGVPALYLATTLTGMILEASHGFAHRFEPLTICSYDVDVDDVADLTSERGRQASGVRLADMSCAWLERVGRGLTPPSWGIADRLMADEKAAALVPSFARGATSDMTNLVLWKWGPDAPHSVKVFDPSGRLPKDQLSWPSRRS